MKGLSGAVTALILVIASVVIALIVVGFAFGLFSSYSSQSAVTAPSTGHIYANDTIFVQISNNGINNVSVLGVSVDGNPVSVQQYYIFNATSGKQIASGNGMPVIPAGGLYTVEFVVSGLPKGLTQDSTHTVQISLANGQTVVANAIYQ